MPSPASRLLQESAPRRLLVVRALQLGDMLCAVPALRQLRRVLPAARITLCSLPWAKPFARRYRAYVDDFIEFPGYPGLPERFFDADAYERFCNAVRRRAFDLAIQLHGSGSFINDMLQGLPVGDIAGFCEEESTKPPRGTFMPWPAEGHEIERLARLTEFLGAPRLSRAVDFPLDANDWSDLDAAIGAIGDEELRTAVAEAGLSGRAPLAIIHPGARFLSRRWPAERFAVIADALAERGLRIAITGSEAEAAVTREVRQRMRRPAAMLAGRTTLGAAAALVRVASLVVTNDTGMSHIAAAVKTPSVVLVLGSEPSRWAPLDMERHRTICHGVPCRPCGYFECPIDMPCAAGITPAAVLDQCDALLSRNIPNGMRRSAPLSLEAAFANESL